MASDSGAPPAPASDGDAPHAAADAMPAPAPAPAPGPSPDPQPAAEKLDALDAASPTVTGREVVHGSDGNGATDGGDAGGGDGDAAGPSAVDDEALLKEFFAEVRGADRDAEVNRILGAFKLNPYEQLGVRFDATADDVQRAYRKSSLLVHPDKCSHPRAQDAFELLGAAVRELREGERAHELGYVLGLARDEVLKARKKEAKSDAVVRLAAVVADGGADAVQAAWEASDAFHEAWKVKARDMLARAEFKRRKLALRLKETEERLEEEASAERKKARAERAHERAWDKSREARVGSWRDFAKGKKPGAPGGAGIKPPKATGFDEERTFVRRPVGEAYRPPPAKPPPRVHKK